MDALFRQMSEVISLREKVAQAELDARIFADERLIARNNAISKRGRSAKKRPKV
jgi:hypothetical protein